MQMKLLHLCTCITRHQLFEETTVSTVVLGPVVQKPINAIPRLKINEGVNFFSPKCCSMRLFGKTLHQKSILKNKNKQKKHSPKS